MGRGRGSFGLSSNRGKRGSGTRFGYRGTGSWRGGRGRGGRPLPSDSPAPKREDDGTLLEEKFERVTLNDEIDEKLGFSRIQDGLKREGWLINMRPVCSSTLFNLILAHVSQTLMKDPEWPSGKAAVDFYFIQDDGGMFKCTFQYEPYFYIACKVRRLPSFGVCMLI
jgi:DNA polymerase epsilon subunit 1